MRVVKELVGNHDIPRSVIFPKGAAGGDRNYTLDAKHLQGENVRTIVDFAGHDPVPLSVSG